MKTVKSPGNEAVFPYIACIPDEISDSPAMILQLHGAGERGNGGDALDDVMIHGFSKVMTDENCKDCILVMPQCPPDSFWVAKIESLHRFIEQMIETYHIDTSRIYLCGLSMGGYGTWYTAMAYPDLFAAIAPCCGGGMAWNAGVLNMPIRAFHGLEDTSVTPINTIEMAKALQGKNPDFHCELYEGVGHNCWDLALSEELLAWLLSQHK